MTEQPSFLDDRMFLLGVFPARIAKDKDDNHQTVVFYDQTPEQAHWVVATYRNVEGYPLVGINHFEREEHARAYKTGLEPTIPLTSLGGRSPASPMSVDDYKAWKEENGFGDFDPSKAARLTGEDRAEAIVQTRDQFVAGLQQVANVLKGAKRA